MNRNVLLIIALITAVAGVFYYKQTQVIDNAVAFDDVEIKADETALTGLAGYITLPSISADEDAIIDLIGAIVIRTRKPDGKEEWTYDMQYRPALANIKTKIVNEQLFQGVVSANADFGGRFKVASANIVTEDLAESTVNNQLLVGYKDRTKIPFKALGNYPVTIGKDYYFVERVVVTDISTRRFRRQSGDGKIKGMAFGANGAVYVERDASRSKKFVSFRPLPVTGMQSSEAGSGSNTTQLAAKARTTSLTHKEASALINALTDKFKGHMPTTAPLQAPQARLPEKLRDMTPIVWIDQIHPSQQSSENRCWIATTAMLLSWKKGREIDEVEAATSLGPLWVEEYERDAALLSKYKLDFINAAGFKYSPAQSYAPSGLISLLRDNGPAWFTIDKDFGRHATILTGVFLDNKEGGYWVSYIDPADGTLKADTYGSYLRRYEAPAYRANEQGGNTVMTERDLDIQVIHW